MDILRLAKDFYGVSMGTVNGWYSAGLLTITETGSYTVTSVNEYGTTTTVQTSYHVCCSGGSDLTVVLSEL